MNGPHQTADFVIIGSGAAGLAAAVTAAEKNIKVIVLEKLPSVGGTSNFFGGTFAVESDMQRKKYITYTRDQAFKNIMEYSHWIANARLVRAYVDESAATIDWLQKQGVKFSDVINNMPDVPQTYHVVEGRGAAAVKALTDRAKEKGVEIKLSTPARKILRENGRITGVIAEENDEEISITSKAVLVASGGYANNKQWIKKYCGFDLDVNLFILGNIEKTGDGISMAWDVGAAAEGLGVLEMLRVGPVGKEIASKNPVEFASMQPDLWVDPKGERFCDEGITYYDTSIGNVNARYKEGYTYSIFDDSIIERIHEKGIDRAVAIENMPGTKPVGFHEALQFTLENMPDDIYMANSIAELAQKMHVNAAVLQATIDEYNSFCEKGHDDIFAKEPKYLWSLRGPKFYAVKMRTICLGSKGGIKVNHKMEVLDKNSDVIPGLYAGGYDAGGLYGDSYPIQVASGTSSAFAINSGRIAGKNALNYISEK